jgi:hypothetical protein
MPTPGVPVILTHSHIGGFQSRVQGAKEVGRPQEEVGPGLTSSVSYMVLLEEKGEGSGSRSSHGLSVDISSSSPFSVAVSHCVPLDWGFKVTTTLPGIDCHWLQSSWHLGLSWLPATPKKQTLPPQLSLPYLLGQEVLVSSTLGVWGFGDPQAGDGWLLPIFVDSWGDGRVGCHCCPFTFLPHCRSGRHVWFSVAQG